MKPINKSASKLVLILVALTICASFIIGVVSGKVTVETKDFLPLVAMVFTYYFTKYSKDSSQSSEKKETFLDDRGA